MPSNGNFFMQAVNAFAAANKQNQSQYRSTAPLDNTPKVASLDFGASGADTSGIMQNQADTQAGAIGSAASVMSNIPGGFGQGFKYGYAGSKVFTAPFLAYRAAKQTKKVLGMQADLAGIQAKSFQTAAEDVLRGGHIAVAGITQQAGQVKASTRVAQAASGVKVAGPGSAAEVLTSQDIAKEMQVNQTLANAIASSYGYQRQKTQAKINQLAYQAAKSSINPWASALASFMTASVEAAPSFMDIGKGKQPTGK